MAWEKVTNLIVYHFAVADGICFVGLLRKTVFKNELFFMFSWKIANLEYFDSARKSSTFLNFM